MDSSILRKTSAWSVDQVEDFLVQALIPVRLACVGRSGTPLLCSVWYLYDAGSIWCATQRGAKLASLLGSDPRCGFEIAGDQPPYKGVRGQGRASLSAADGPTVLARLINRYLQGRDPEFARWLISRQQDEVAIRIRPDWLTSWDFSARMGN